MKIVTNIRFHTVAGIAQYLSNLIQHNEQASEAVIYGIDLIGPGEHREAPAFDASRMRHFHLAARTVAYPPLNEVLASALSLEDVRAAYRPVIDTYAEYIREIRPDCIVINGTYAMPWCLLQAARAWGKASIVIHYHGILSKEVEHWQDPRAKGLMEAMEREFDIPEALYIFPSQLARETVEREVYRHPILHALVVPNPVPDHFFEARRKRRSFSIGMVARWNKIKNVDVLLSLARYAKRKKEMPNFPLVTNLPQSHEEYVKVASLLDLKDPIPHHKLAHFYSSLGVLLLPSRFETYGNVAQEALAAGTPVLVSAAAGVAETLHFVGLGGWVHDFSSTAQVFEAAVNLAMTTVPHHARQLLQVAFSNTAVFKTYFRALKDWS